MARNVDPNQVSLQNVDQFLRRKATPSSFTQGAIRGVTEAAKTFVKPIETAVKAPVRAARFIFNEIPVAARQAEQSANLSLKLQQDARRAQEQGDFSLARRFQSQADVERQKGLNIPQQLNRRKLELATESAKAGVGTILSARGLTVPGLTLGAAGVGAGLSGAGAALTGGDVATSIGRAVGQAPTTAGLLSFTNPATDLLSRSIGGRTAARAVGRFGVSGTANVAEDRLLASLQGDAPNDFLSFLIGGVTGAAPVALETNAAKKFVDNIPTWFPKKARKQMKDLVENARENLDLYDQQFVSDPGGQLKSRLQVDMEKVINRNWKEIKKAGELLREGFSGSLESQRGAVRLDLGLSKDKPNLRVEDGQVKISEPKKKTVRVGERKLNIDNLNLSDSQKEIVEDLSTTLKDPVLRNVDVVELSKQVDPSGTAQGREGTARVIAEQLADRQKVVTLTNELDDLKAAGASKNEVANKLSEIAEASRVSRKQGTDIGRQLQARSILADELDTPMQKVFKLLDNAGVEPSKYVRDAAGVDWNNAKEVTKFYRKHVPATMWEFLDELRYSSMLSSPTTHSVNFASNLLQVATQAPRKVLAGGYDWALSGLSGRERQRFASEVAPYTKGIFSALPNAKESALKILRGESQITNLDLNKIPTGTRLSEAITTPLRVLEAGDIFFKSMLESGEQAALRHRARIKGESVTPLTEAAIAKKAKKDALEILFRGELNKDGQGWMLDVMDNMTGLIMASRKAGKLGKASQLMIPFVQTPMNILKQGVEYSPAGFVNMIGSKGETADQLAKATLGSMVMATAGALVNTDNATWDTPTNSDERAEFFAAGRQPYSIKIGDKWYSYSKLGPLAYPIAAAAAIKHGLKESDIEDKQKLETAGHIAAMIGSFFTDQSYMQGVGDIVDAIRGDEFKQTRLLAGVPQQFVPFRAFMGWMARMIDPVYRKVNWKDGIPESIAQSILSQIPFASKNLPAYIDPFGNESTRPLPFVNAFSPVRISQEKPEGERLFQTKQTDRMVRKQTRLLKKQFEEAREQGEAIATTDAQKLQILFDVRELAPQPGESAFDKVKREKKMFSKVDDILDSNLIDSDQKTVLLESLGVSREDAEYYNIARLTNDEKKVYALEEIAGIAKTSKDRGEMLKFLSDGRREINGKAIITTGVLNELEDMGLISKQEKKMLKDLEFGVDGSVKVKTTGRGSGARLKKVTPVKPGRVRVTLPTGKTRKIKAPRISQQQLESVFV